MDSLQQPLLCHTYLFSLNSASLRLQDISQSSFGILPRTRQHSQRHAESGYPTSIAIIFSAPFSCSLSPTCCRLGTKNMNSAEDFKAQDNTSIAYAAPINEEFDITDDFASHLCPKLSELEMPKQSLRHLLDFCILKHDLQAGRWAHKIVIGSGYELDSPVACRLIRMFTLFHCIEQANQIFYKLPEASLLAWDALLSGYIRSGMNEEAMMLYQQMLLADIKPDGHIFVSVIAACSNIGALDQGRHVHSCLVESGFQFNVHIASNLICMYARCGNLHDACVVFAKLPKLDAFVWSALIAAFVQHDSGREALHLFRNMMRAGLKPDHVTMATALRACILMADIDEGQRIHAFIIAEGLEQDAVMGSCLLDMYGKCASIEAACITFDRTLTHNAMTWGTLIAGFVHHKRGLEAIQTYRKMLQENIRPGPFILSSVLKACCLDGAIEMGRKIHVLIIENGFERDVVIGGALTHMYADLGKVEDAQYVICRLGLRDAVSWSSLIVGCNKHGYYHEAMWFFREMLKKEVTLNRVTFSSILKTCCRFADLENGRIFHAHIVENGFALDNFLGISLIDMYSECGALMEASLVFNLLCDKNVVAWTALIGGYTKHEHGKETLELFQQMHGEGIEADPTTYVSILKSCSDVAALEQGRKIHAKIIADGFEVDAFIVSALVNMYSGCGSLKDAEIAFHRLPHQTTGPWNTMISCYAEYCDYSSAFQSFGNMQDSGVPPDPVTFLCLLSACLHARLVHKGYMYMRLMRDRYFLTPSCEHFNSMVDVLSHAGSFPEAEDLLETISFPRNTIGWMTLLHGCQKHVDVNVGRRCFDWIVTLDHGKTAAYVMMSNIYLNSGIHSEVARIENMRLCLNAWKKPAKCSIEIDNQVHDFTVGEFKHPQIHLIRRRLQTLHKKLKKDGYKPQTNLILTSSSDERKEDLLCGHCEKLAIAFGLISTTSGSTIRISKNMRVCSDCHNAVKLISRIEKREIIIKDTYCVHCFRDGLCSCKDN